MESEKPTTLSNGLILVQVPKDEFDEFDLSFPYPTMDNSGFVYLMGKKGRGRKQLCQLGTKKDCYMLSVLGTITKDECSFDCREYTQLSFHSNPITPFKEMIEAETQFLFENPIPKPIQSEYKSIPLFARNATEWLINQTRVIEKLVVLKEVK